MFEFTIIGAAPPENAGAPAAASREWQGAEAVAIAEAFTSLVDLLSAGAAQQDLPAAVPVAVPAGTPALDFAGMIDAAGIVPSSEAQEAIVLPEGLPVAAAVPPGGGSERWRHFSGLLLPAPEASTGVVRSDSPADRTTYVSIEVLVEVEAPADVPAATGLRAREIPQPVDAGKVPAAEESTEVAVDGNAMVFAPTTPLIATAPALDRSPLAERSSIHSDDADDAPVLTEHVQEPAAPSAAMPVLPAASTIAPTAAAMPQPAANSEAPESHPLRSDSAEPADGAELPPVAPQPPVGRRVDAVPQERVTSQSPAGDDVVTEPSTTPAPIRPAPRAQMVIDKLPIGVAAAAPPAVSSPRVPSASAIPEVVAALAAEVAAVAGSTERMAELPRQRHTPTTSRTVGSSPMSTAAARVETMFARASELTSGSVDRVVLPLDVVRVMATRTHVALPSPSISVTPVPVAPTVAFVVPAAVTNAVITLPRAHDVPAANAAEIVQAIRMQFLGGGGEAHIRLEPNHFGEVTVSVRVDQGTVAVRLQAEVPAVREWLQTHQQMLRQGLAEQQLTLDRIEIVEPSSTESRERHGERHREERPRRDARRASRDDAQSTFELEV